MCGRNVVVYNVSTDVGVNVGVDVGTDGICAVWVRCLCLLSFCWGAVQVSRSVKVTIYLPELFMEKLREAYPECRSDGELIIKHLMELHAEWLEHRSFSDELTTIARSYLLNKYGKEYEKYITSQRIPVKLIEQRSK